MQSNLDLEQRLLGVWSQLGADWHPEDAFLCRWLSWLSPAPAARPAARAIAHAALDQLDGPHGDFHQLSMPALIATLPTAGLPAALPVAERFADWLVDSGEVDALRSQQWLREIRELRGLPEADQAASLAA